MSFDGQPETLDFELIERVPHPQWQPVWEWVSVNIPAERRSEYYLRAVRIWLGKLKGALRGEYRTTESGEWLLLSGTKVAKPAEALEFSKAQFKRIAKIIPIEPEPGAIGPRVMIVFDKPREYYSYIAAYYPTDGQYGGSGGVCLRTRGYLHVALNGFGWQSHSAIIHELVHVRMTHLQSPCWLEEGLASYLPQTLIGPQAFKIDREQAREHGAYWRANSLAKFWNGTSFHLPDEGERLSYQLAEVLVRNLMTDHPTEFGRFVCAAKQEDDGESAARQHLGRSLCEVAAQFLGPGDWHASDDRSAD